MQNKLKELRLSKEHYQPFILKFMNDFVNHHGLQPHVVALESNLKLHVALSMIIDVMARSMGDEKREQILKELDEYNMSLPACFRD